VLHGSSSRRFKKYPTPLPSARTIPRANACKFQWDGQSQIEAGRAANHSPNSICFGIGVQWSAACPAVKRPALNRNGYDSWKTAPLPSPLFVRFPVDFPRSCWRHFLDIGLFLSTLEFVGTTLKLFAHTLKLLGHTFPFYGHTMSFYGVTLKFYRLTMKLFAHPLTFHRATLAHFGERELESGPAKRQSGGRKRGWAFGPVTLGSRPAPRAAAQSDSASRRVGPNNQPVQIRLKGLSRNDAVGQCFQPVSKAEGPGIIQNGCHLFPGTKLWGSDGRWQTGWKPVLLGLPSPLVVPLLHRSG